MGEPFPCSSFGRCAWTLRWPPARCGPARATTAARPSGRTCARRAWTRCLSSGTSLWGQVDGRAAHGTPRVRSAVPQQDRSLHAPAQGEGRYHWLGSGDRMAGRYIVGRTYPLRFALHSELVLFSGYQDSVHDDLEGIREQERLLGKVLPGPRVQFSTRTNLASPATSLNRQTLVHSITRGPSFQRTAVVS